MKLVVLNGSPKGEKSVTLQHILWWQAGQPGVSLGISHVAFDIQVLRADPERLQQVLATVRAADALLWVSPVYHHLVPSQVFRFLDLCGEEKSQTFRGKLSAIVFSSIHYYDSTAIDWLTAVSEDLGMSVYGAFSAEMHDLGRKSERERFSAFMKGFTEAIGLDPVLPRNWPPLHATRLSPIVPQGSYRVDLGGKRVLILQDRRSTGAGMESMLARLRGAFTGGLVDLKSIEEIGIKGGCLGCCGCCFANECSWDGRDGYREFFEEHVRPADIIVYAVTIEGRAFSSDWKEYFDRSFFNTHVPVYTGKQMAWLVSGPLSALGYMRQIMQAYADVGRANPAGILTDESGDADSLGAAIDGVAWRLATWQSLGYIAPRTFAGIAGIKIFRDEVWGGMRLIFRVDHKVFKKNGTYDFPHRHWLRRIGMVLAWPLFGIKGFQRVFKARMRDEMVKPIRAVVDAEIRRQKKSSATTGESV
ncbi:MAG TPA: NAD(P)H-dependent oxidoreductase [Spirochaetota bacterium]|nr:NAD(P)H-dependent oxidoreductase [Spirochaetota bacterium]